MPKRTSYAQGTPNWVDLQTTDPEAAKAFYSGLFGWRFDDMPVPKAVRPTRWPSRTASS